MECGPVTVAIQHVQLFVAMAYKLVIVIVSMKQLVDYHAPVTVYNFVVARDTIARTSVMVCLSHCIQLK